ncbi:hypothetical protein DZF91_22675, partial [Actinomadura logoneensis]
AAKAGAAGRPDAPGDDASALWKSLDRGEDPTEATDPAATDSADTRDSTATSDAGASEKADDMSDDAAAQRRR